jgi:hypothetical protein
MPSVPVEQWPLLLAGPIVRRVEPGRASVWVALKEARAVRLTVYAAPVDTGPGTGMLAGPAPILSGDAVTIRIGERLHVAVVTAEPPSGGGSLTAGQSYAYNVAFGAPTGAFTATADLKSLQLLRDRTASTDPATHAPRHVALGYETGLLPTFVMPPADLTGLRVAHGSCRRPHADCADMLAALDRLIREGRGAVERRPQQLFLTGDQIYADDVATVVCHLATKLGGELLGAVEHVPMTWRGDTADADPVLEPVDRRHFPAGLRKAAVMGDAKLTTSDGESHLLGLGEFLAVHLLAFSNELWPATLPTFADVFWAETFDRAELDKLAAGTATPPDVWRVHAGLGFTSRHGIAAKYGVAGSFTGSTTKSLLAKVAADKALAKAYTDQSKVVAAFRDGLPEARRALANVATYMIFDDHEVTDDWNLSQRWKDRLFTSPLGRTVLRNGVVAYLVCQGWGNDPAAFAATGSPAKELLDAVPRLFPAGHATPPDATAADTIDVVVGLAGTGPAVRWDYRVDGPKHRVLVLDTRTRRGFRSRIAPPTNLPTTVLDEQIPAGPLPAGLELLVVVAPLPVFGLPVLDELGGPLAYRLSDAIHADEIGAMPGTDPDAAEAWINDKTSFEALLKRLATYRKVIVLSGDVHYAHSGGASFWTGAEATPSRFAQFTSSGLKNVWPHPVLTLSRSFGLTQSIERIADAVERLGWNAESPAVLDVPDGVDLLPAGRARLRATPVLLPTHGWPPGTTVVRPPDWAWRFRPARDTRPIAERPEPARPAPLDDSDPAADAPTTIEGYRLAARRHARQLERVSFTSQVLFDSNVGVVRLERSDGRLNAVHELHARPAGATDAAVYTVHSVVLEPAATDPPESRPTIGAST